MEPETNPTNWASIGRRWAEDDPDPETARIMREIIDSGDATRAMDCFLPPLEFGTAGLRGTVGPGPARMNLAVIRRVTRALAAVVEYRIEQAVGADSVAASPVIVGFDGRVDSRQFAREAVGVLAETRLAVAFFERPVPTPLVAFAAQRFASPAAIVVTASHNPPEYNGYKVYGAEAIQIIPPFDLEVARQLGSVGRACEIACRRDAFDQSTTQAQRIDESIGDAYIDAVLSGRVRGAHAEPIRIAYTPLHGVGGPWVERAFRLAGYADLHVEPSQREVDGHFPTVRFPNPEEVTTLTRGLYLAANIDADVLLVNDPDADRMGAAIRTTKGSYRILSGNEIGIILADYLLSHADQPRDMAVASTIVSTPMVKRIAAHYGAHAETTLTGFKWLWTAMRGLERDGNKRFALCWEEALGYSTHATVRDKDGIAAALVFADWVSECSAEGVRPIERLAELYRRHGAWGSAPYNVVRPIATGATEIQRMMTRLALDPPRLLCGRKVTGTHDYNRGAGERPVWCGASNMIVLDIDGGARIVVRPSGTEPKLKCYADVEEQVRAREDALEAYTRARATAEALNEALVQRLVEDD